MLGIQEKGRCSTVGAVSSCAFMVSSRGRSGQGRGGLCGPLAPVTSGMPWYGSTGTVYGNHMEISFIRRICSQVAFNHTSSTQNATRCSSWKEMKSKLWKVHRGSTIRSHQSFKMSDKNALEVVKEKINGVLVKYPVVDEPLTKLSEKVKVDKAFIVLAIATVPLLLCLALGNAHVLMYVLLLLVFVVVSYPHVSLTVT